MARWKVCVSQDGGLYEDWDDEEFDDFYDAYSHAEYLKGEYGNRHYSWAVVDEDGDEMAPVD